MRLIRWIARLWDSLMDSGAYRYAELYGGPEVVDLLYEPEDSNPA